MNCQFVKNKKAELHTIIDSAKPDINLGNESWLTPDIKKTRKFSPTPLMQFRKPEQVMPMVVSQGGTLIFSYIRRLGPFFWVQNSEFQYFLGFQKNEYFWGVFRFCGYFFGSSQNWTSLRVISMQFRVFFFKVKVQNWDIFLGC